MANSQLKYTVYQNGQVVARDVSTKPSIRFGSEAGCDVYLPPSQGLDEVSVFITFKRRGWRIDARVNGKTLFFRKLQSDDAVEVGDFLFHLTSDHRESDLEIKSDSKSIRAARTVVHPRSAGETNKIADPEKTVLSVVADNAISVESDRSSVRLNRVPVDESALEPDIFSRLSVGVPSQNVKGPVSSIVEGAVVWKNRVIDVQQFYPGDPVSMAPSSHPGYHLKVDLLAEAVNFAKFTPKGVVCALPQNQLCYLRGGEETLDRDQILEKKWGLVSAGKFYFRLPPDYVCDLPFAPDFNVFFRWIPEPPRLFRGRLSLQDYRFREVSTASAIVHIGLVLVCLFLFMGSERVTDAEPDRIARIVYEPMVLPAPTPIPPPAPLRKPTPYNSVETQSEKKIHAPVKYKPKVVRRERRERVANTQPVTPSPQPPVKAPDNGILNALKAISQTSLDDSTGPIPINLKSPRRTGAEGVSTGQVLGDLKAQTGKLPLGSQTLTSKDSGWGGARSKASYSVGGLAAGTGKRVVAGQVLGTPQFLSSVGRKVEGLTEEEVMKEVSRHLGKVQSCYEQALIEKPSLSGRVEYEWLIQPNGRVTKVSVKKSEIKDADQLHRCVKNIFMKITFPKAKNGHSTLPSIGFPFGRL